MQNLSKNWLIVLALIIVIGIGVYAYKNPPGPQEQDNDGISNIDISNWKNYRESQFGFEFKYPEDSEPKIDPENPQALLYVLFNTKVEENDAPRFASAVISGGIEANKPKFSNELNNLEDVSLAGKDGFRVIYGDAGCVGESTVLPLNEHTLVLSVGYCEGDLIDPEENYFIYNKVLETLKID